MRQLTNRRTKAKSTPVAAAILTAIIDAAVLVRMDMIVMGARGIKGMKALFIGSGRVQQLLIPRARSRHQNAAVEGVVILNILRHGRFEAARERENS
jgi:hypothetical protein